MQMLDAVVGCDCTHIDSTSTVTVPLHSKCFDRVQFGSCTKLWLTFAAVCVEAPSAPLLHDLQHNPTTNQQQLEVTGGW